mmetsp:Transcript_8597/g.15600  ORF Transcript_8597/g.15600 Transcript_8597/m.15600 type:complete len:388 (-) Transcript_8597:38-1201(-)
MFGFGGPANGIPMGGGPRRFEEQYHCYSVAYADKPHLEGGDKIILPPSALDTLSRLLVEYPMLFNLSSESGNSTHSGVLEFSAPEGSCYIPYWVMQNLLIPEGGLLTVKNVSLPKASLIKLKPQHVDWLEISNPRAVLEHALRNFSCVTKGDTICIPYNDRNYHLELKDVQPQDAACIIETDCNVDFEAPVGYVEPDYKKMAEDKQREQYANMPKQSRFGGASPHLSASSPAQSRDGSVNGSVPPLDLGGAEVQKGPRIVNGQIIKGDDDKDKGPDEALLADRVGATGVQPNAAVPTKAPTNTYWAVAGGGSRLDGKAPSPLKDTEGNVQDPRELRLAAAAAREAANKSDSVQQASQVKRKSLIGNKYSKRKIGGATAFNGGGNTMK